MSCSSSTTKTLPNDMAPSFRQRCNFTTRFGQIKKAHSRLPLSSRRLPECAFNLQDLFLPAKAARAFSFLLQIANFPRLYASSHNLSSITWTSEIAKNMEPRVDVL